MELYNEELTDLLSMDNDKEKRLRLLEDRSGVVVQGLEEMVVKSAAGARFSADGTQEWAALSSDSLHQAEHRGHLQDMACSCCPCHAARCLCVL
jgi:hypothetical protein